MSPVRTSLQMLVSRSGELETDGNLPVIQEFTLKHDTAGFTFDNGPYFVMERCIHARILYIIVVHMYIGGDSI